MNMEKSELTQWSKEAVESLHEIFKTQAVINYLENNLFREQMRFQSLTRQHNLLFPHYTLDLLTKEGAGAC